MVVEAVPRASIYKNMTRSRVRVSLASTFFVWRLYRHHWTPSYYYIFLNISPFFEQDRVPQRIAAMKFSRALSLSTLLALTISTLIHQPRQSASVNTQP